MDILEIDHLYYENTPAVVKISSDGICLVTSTNENTISKDAIKTISLFHSVREYCLRIITENQSFDIINLHESFVNKLRTFIKDLYNIIVDIADLEVVNTTHGNLIYSNSIVYLQGKKNIFSIPKSKIQKVIELENEIEFHLPNSEIVFNTSSNISQFVGNKKYEEICIMNNINCISPRSKTTLIFYDDYFISKGSSYDHSVVYNSIEEVLFLKRDSNHYLVLKLANYIVQGQTRYHSLVFLLTDKEIEVVAKPTGILKSFYKGPQNIVLLQIIEDLIKISAHESQTAIKCTNKINEGYLYLMPNSIHFLPKLISIEIASIVQVEFLRINLSLTQAKTFDMIVYADKPYNFNGISKEFFNELEIFFTENKIRIVSEVVEESLSNDLTEEDNDSNISDLVNSESE